MRILITGAKGQLGQSLAEQARGRSDLILLPAGRDEADLSKPEALQAFILAARPDIVINAAAYTAVDAAEDDSDRAFLINGAGAGAVAEAAAAAGAGLIHISTDYVFNGRSRTAYREDEPIDPIGVYGRSKAAGEDAVRRVLPRHLIFRTAWVYSPFGQNFVRSILRAAETRDTLTVVDDQIGSPTSALDLAAGLLDIAVRWREETGTFHLAGAGKATWFAVAETILDESRRQNLPAAKVSPIASADWPTRAVRPACSVLDTTKVQRTFGITLPEWEGSVRAVVARLAEERRACG